MSSSFFLQNGPRQITVTISDVTGGATVIGNQTMVVGNNNGSNGPTNTPGFDWEKFGRNMNDLMSNVFNNAGNSSVVNVTNVGPGTTVVIDSSNVFINGKNVTTVTNSFFENKPEPVPQPTPSHRFDETAEQASKKLYDRIKGSTLYKNNPALAIMIALGIRGPHRACTSDGALSQLVNEHVRLIFDCMNDMDAFGAVLEHYYKGANKNDIFEAIDFFKTSIRPNEAYSELFDKTVANLLSKTPSPNLNVEIRKVLSLAFEHSMKKTIPTAYTINRHLERAPVTPNAPSEEFISQMNRYFTPSQSSTPVATSTTTSTSTQSPQSSRPPQHPSMDDFFPIQD